MVAKKRPSKRFRARGQRLWNAHHDQVKTERGLVLLEEACRIVDRLEQLDRLLKGDVDVWCSLAAGRDGTVVRVDGALVEARQQANVLRQLIVALPIEGGDGGDGDGDGWVDDL